MNDYVASLPERAVRVAAAGAGGLVYETTEVALPAAIRRSRLYQATIARVLRILIELVGGVTGVYRHESVSARDLAVRKLAGNGIELAGFLAIGWSPVWLLAAAADLTAGTRVYLRTLVAELKRAAVLPQAADASSVEQVLQTLEHATGTAADTIDVPPLNTSDLRRSWRELKQQAGELPAVDELAALYADLQKVATAEGRSLLSVSSAVAAGAAQAGAQMGNVYLFEYYRRALGSIAAEGWPAYLQRISKPYSEAAARHFDRQHTTLTERLLLRWRRWRARRAAAAAARS
jgi:hypothetical protein